MPLEFVRGDLFATDAPVLVCPVNTVGTLGGGLAREFKRRFPFCAAPYARACREDAFGLGQALVVKAPRRELYVVHVATKEHWRRPSTLAYVAQALDALAATIADRGFAAVALPALGCGLGGLAFADVRPQMETKLRDTRARVVVYEPW